MTAGEIRELSSFAAAALKLHLQVGGPLRGIDCNRVEDGRHALLLFEHGPDNWIGAEFELAEFVSEAEFDAYKYIDVFNR
jgi:hypothetical protein